MADFPRTILPAYVSPFRLPPPFISRGHTGKAQRRAALGMGREWTEVWSAFDPTDEDGAALLAFIEDAWSQGDVFDITHLVSPGSGLPKNGLGALSPLVMGASQTGASLVTDGWGLNTPNLASNPGFDTGLAPHFAINSGGLWAAQATGIARSAPNALTYNPAGQTSQAAVEINGARGTPANHLVSVTSPGKMIYGEVHVRAFNAGPANTAKIFLLWMNAAGGLISSVSASHIPTQVYSEIAVAGIAPALTAYVVVQLAVDNDGHTTNPLAFDDVYFADATVAKAGDVFRVSGLPQLFRVTADASMNATGVATLPIYPPITVGGSPADNAALTISGAKLSAYIAEPPNLPAVPPGNLLSGLTLTFREAL